MALNSGGLPEFAYFGNQDGLLHWEAPLGPIPESADAGTYPARLEAIPGVHPVDQYKALALSPDCDAEGVPSLIRCVLYSASPDLPNSGMPEQWIVLAVRTKTEPGVWTALELAATLIHSPQLCPNVPGGFGLPGALDHPGAQCENIDSVVYTPLALTADGGHVRYLYSVDRKLTIYTANCSPPSDIFPRPFCTDPSSTSAEERELHLGWLDTDGARTDTVISPKSASAATMRVDCADRRANLCRERRRR